METRLVRKPGDKGTQALLQKYAEQNWQPREPHPEAEKATGLTPKRYHPRRVGVWLRLGPAEHRQEMDNADPGLEGGAESLYHPVRGPDAAALIERTLNEKPFTQNSGHPRRQR